MTKNELRRLVLARRDAEPDREAKGRLIQERLLLRPEYQRAAIVLSYIGVKSEVGTGIIVQEALESGKHLAVPYVTPDGLRAAFIQTSVELEPSKFGLLDPVAAVRDDPARNCPVPNVQLFVVPGVAFDRRGGRLGHGKAYYDRMLSRAGVGARFLALAFDCQMVDQVPMTADDVYMDGVLTEKDTYLRLAASGR
jgi:5-formyltetrahydrofolate cyclo-ligase